MKKLFGRTALITGAAQGIGAMIAHRYAEEGADLILVDHSYKGLEKIDDELASFQRSVTLVPLDLCQENGIEEMALHLENRLTCLDILVGNAAVLGSLMPLTHLDALTWNKVWQTNFMANWRLLKSFESLLNKSTAGRVIFVTAAQSRGIHPFWGPYSLSKKALEDMVFLYTIENMSNLLKVNLIDPGDVDTFLYRQANPGGAALSISPHCSIMDQFVNLAQSHYQMTGQRIVN